jgi:hypothetical protein
VKISGDAVLHAPIERVWQALRDPAVLVQTIPGCERMDATGPGAYRMTVTAAVGSTKGTYSGTVRVHDGKPPSSFAISASAAGAPGTIGTDVQVRLSEVDGSTLLGYDADATVGGMIGGIGQRMLAGVARRTADEFFAAVDDALTGEPAAVGFAEAPAGRSLTPGGLVAAACAVAGFVVGAVWGRRRG